MTVHQLRWVFASALAGIIVLAVLAEPFVLGASAEWSNSRYRFAGGTHPYALVVSAVIGVLYALLMRARPVREGLPTSGVMRRFGAFYLDFLFAMLALTPAVGIVPMLVEWKRTGTFAWCFERTTQAATDVPMVALSFVLLTPGLLLYYSIPLVLRRPSPGACITGYQVIADDGQTTSLGWAVRRTLVGCIALGAWFITPFAGRDKAAGRIWLDKAFRTRAVLLS